MVYVYMYINNDCDNPRFACTNPNGPQKQDAPEQDEFFEHFEEQVETQ